MSDFLRFFNSLVKHYPLHILITYDKTCDWQISIYKKGCGENGEDLYICYAQDGDIELCFAKAQVLLKQWLIENNNGY